MTTTAMTLDQFKLHAASMFVRISEKMTGGPVRHLLAKEFEEKDIDLVIRMAEEGYGLDDEDYKLFPEGTEPKINETFWAQMFMEHQTWAPPVHIKGQALPEVGMWVVRKGDEPTQVTKVYQVGEFKIMPGDENRAWVTTADGSTTCDGTYVVLGFDKP